MRTIDGINEKRRELIDIATTNMRKAFKMGLRSEEIEAVYQAEIRKMLNDIAELKRQVNEKDSTILTQEEALQTIKSNFDKQINELTIENDALKSQIAKLNDEINALKYRMGNDTGAIKYRIGELESEKKAVEYIADIIIRFKYAVIKSMSVKINEQRNEIERLKGTISYYEYEKSILENELTNARADVRKYINMTFNEFQTLLFIRGLGEGRIASPKFDTLSSSIIDYRSSSDWFENAVNMYGIDYYNDMINNEYTVMYALKEYIDMLYDVKVEYRNDYVINQLTGREARPYRVMGNWCYFPIKLNDEELEKTRVKANMITRLYLSASWIYDGYEHIGFTRKMGASLAHQEISKDIKSIRTFNA